MDELREALRSRYEGIAAIMTAAAHAAGVLPPDVYLAVDETDVRELYAEGNEDGVSAPRGGDGGGGCLLVAGAARGPDVPPQPEVGI